MCRLLLWELMAVQPVFESKEPKKIAADVLKNIRPPIPSSCPEPLGSLMARYTPLPLPLPLPRNSPELPPSSLPLVFLPSSFVNFTTRCWDEDPMVRPTFQEIVQELRPLGNLDADNSRR